MINANMPSGYLETGPYGALANAFKLHVKLRSAISNRTATI